MLERSRRPLGDDERRVLEGYRRDTIGSIRLWPKWTAYGGLAGFMLAGIWLIVVHWGDPHPQIWILAALPFAGIAAGFPVDFIRLKKERRQGEAAAAARWDPVIAVGVVEHVVASASKAIRIDDNAANSAWFLQVEERRILCVWDWADTAAERVELDVIPAKAPLPLKISWAGEKLPSLRPKRKFKRGEHQPEPGDVLDGTLDELDALLARAGGAAKSRRKPARQTARAARAGKLAADVEPLAFYKYLAAEEVSGAKAEIENGADDWYLAADRCFDADAERLAEGGVGDLLDYMRPVLTSEGWTLGAIDQSYDEQRGYTLRVGDECHTIWGEGEGKRAWELATERAAALINHGLAQAGSAERVHILRGGEDAAFVLLTPALREAIAASGAFPKHELPNPVPSPRAAGRGSG